MIKVVPSANKKRPYMVAKTSSVILSNGDKMYIPVGYLTDYASIPSLLKIFLDPIGKEADSYIIHDFLYHYQGYFTNKTLTEFKAVSRNWADREMRYQMEKVGSPRWRIKAYYLAVRLLGWTGFGKI